MVVKWGKFWDHNYMIKYDYGLYFGSFIYESCYHGSSGYDTIELAEKATTDMIVSLVAQTLHMEQHA